MSSSDPRKVISRDIVVASPPGAIFDLLADPRRHHEIDGSGSVVASQIDAPERLSLGARFGMKMRIVVPYRITNEVVEFEEGRRIAWRHLGGHVWRYVLEPVEGGTKVTEQFDWTNNRSPIMLRIMRAQENNTQSIEKTLQNLRDRFAR